MGFIGRKSGADTTSSEIDWKEIWYSQNQQEAVGTGLGKGKTKETQTVELWSSLARMSDTAACCPSLILTVPSALPPGSRDKAPVRSKAPVRTLPRSCLCPGHQEMESRKMSPQDVRRIK